MDIVATRRILVAEVMGRIRQHSINGVNSEVLEEIRKELIELAGHRELFPVEEFPAVAGQTSSMYRLSEDPDHRFALAVASPAEGRSTPPHLHRTWAVIAGIHGREHNRFYRRLDDGTVEQHDSLDITPGKAHAMMPDDIHSIHLGEDGPHCMLHLYGLSIEHIDDRMSYDAEKKTWKTFPAAFGVKSAAGAL